MSELLGERERKRERAFRVGQFTQSREEQQLEKERLEQTGGERREQIRRG